MPLEVGTRDGHYSVTAPRRFTGRSEGVTEPKNLGKAEASEPGNDSELDEKRVDPAQEELEKEERLRLLNSFYDACEKANRIKGVD